SVQPRSTRLNVLPQGRNMLTFSVVALLVLMAATIPVAIVLVILAFALGYFYSDFPVYLAAGEVLWSNSDNYTLIAIPLFVLIGEILRSEEHTSELQSRENLVCRLLLE